MPAFRYSQSINADLLELDVHLSKDGQVVVFHDDTLERMCGAPFKSKTIGDYEFKHLPSLEIPLHLNTLSHVMEDKESYKMPLLNQLLHEFPTTPMQIDVKSGSTELIEKVGNLIQIHKRQHLTVWGSFRSSQNTSCYKFDPSIPLFFSIYRAFKSRILYALGLHSWMKIHESALIMPKIWVFMSKGWISDLNSRGVGVLVFGKGGSLDSEEDWGSVKNIGANGICSNSPTKLMKWLSENPLTVFEKKD